MQTVSASQLIGVWEQSLLQQPVDRALTFLAAACPGIPLDVLAGFSVGRRDACLLGLRERTFGQQIAGLVNCQSCGETLQLNFTTADLRAEPPVEAPGEVSLRVSGYEVQFRLPNSKDLMAVARVEDIRAKRQSLLERCVLSAAQDGEERCSAQLPLEVQQGVVEAMAENDPQADVKLALTCPGCKHQWEAAFDIASFFWRELNAWANRLLREVHTLAYAYGWYEADILAMNPNRRRLYIEMVSG